jgi:glycosyltransferase involved in cell wall biosynthesis
LEKSGVKDGVPFRRVELKTYKLNSKFSALKFIEYVYKIKKLGNQADVWVCNDFEALMVYHLASKFGLKSRLVYDCHEFQSEREGIGKYFKKFIRRMEKRVLQKNTPVFHVSQGILEIYQERYHLENQHLVMNLPLRGSSSNGFIVFRQKFDIPEKAGIFIFQGKLSPGRGIEEILHAFTELDPRKYVIVLMGFGPMEEDISYIAKKNGNIFLHPAVPQSEIVKHTSSANWGILNLQNTCLNHYYSMPNKLFEYIQAGIPILVSNLKESRNFVEENEIGLVIENSSVESLKAVITEAERADNNYFTRKVRGIAKRYTWENQEDNIYAVFDKIDKR